MKYRLLLSCAVLAIVTPATISVARADEPAAEVADATTASNATTLTGEYVWNHRDNTGRLRAVFTPSGPGTWDVEFHFRFRSKPHVYSGSAKGSLTDGVLEGTVLNETERRTFTFIGRVKDGAFDGAHAEIEDGEPYKTGTLTLRP